MKRDSTNKSERHNSQKFSCIQRVCVSVCEAINEHIDQTCHRVSYIIVMIDNSFIDYYTRFIGDHRSSSSVQPYAFGVIDK